MRSCAPVNPVTVRFLGCGDAFGSGGRLQTCFMLDDGQQPLLIDCGATALIALKRAGIDPAAIEWVALSHLHGDHFGGLPWLILDGQFNGRTRPLVIAGAVDTQRRLRGAFEALYPSAVGADLPYELSFVELAHGERVELGPAAVTPFDAEHGSGTPFALRVEYGGKIVTYSGDSAWTDNLLDASRGADLFVCECQEYDKPIPGHLDYRTLQAKRSELDCERLIITHMAEDMLARAGELDFETASDGMIVEV